MSRRYNNNQSSGGPQSHTQTYRTIVVGGGGVGKSAITIQFIQVSENTFKCKKSNNNSNNKLKYIRGCITLRSRFGERSNWNNDIDPCILSTDDHIHSIKKKKTELKYLKNYATIHHNTHM